MDVTKDDSWGSTEFMRGSTVECWLGKEQLKERKKMALFHKSKVSELSAGNR